jgi:hypothetical protein
VVKYKKTMKKLLFSLVILSFLISGFVLAQQNELPSAGITPDSPFYFLKTWKETIQTFFTFGAENKAEQYMHLANVRLAEYQKMIENGKTDIAQKTLNKYQKQLDQATQIIQNLQEKGNDVGEISQKAQDAVLKHIEVLQENLQNVPEAAKKGLQKAIENSSKVIEDVKGKIKEVKGQKETACINSGGTVSTSLCCQSVSDFPNLCLIGACGCSSENSHEVKICNCPENECFNGNQCVKGL